MKTHNLIPLETNSLEKLEEVPTKKIAPKYVAIKQCSNAKKGLVVGENLPTTWSNEAIKYLLSRNAIKLVE